MWGKCLLGSSTSYIYCTIVPLQYPIIVWMWWDAAELMPGPEAAAVGGWRWVVTCWAGVSWVTGAQCASPASPDHTRNTAEEVVNILSNFVEKGSQCKEYWETRYCLNIMRYTQNCFLRRFFLNTWAWHPNKAANWTVRNALLIYAIFLFL